MTCQCYPYAYYQWKTRPGISGNRPILGINQPDVNVDAAQLLTLVPRMPLTRPK